MLVSISENEDARVNIFSAILLRPTFVNKAVDMLKTVGSLFLSASSGIRLYLGHFRWPQLFFLTI